MNTELESFRRGFCFKAAELGFIPSELLNAKQAGYVKDIANFLTENGPATIAGLTVLGAGGGALANYLYNKGKFEIDPEDTILPDYGPTDEAKQLHLLAKYRNAKRIVKSDIA